MGESKGATISLSGGAGRVVFSRLFFHLMFKAGFFFHTPVEARFFFHKELKVRLFFYSHVSSQRYSHYFQGWGKIIFFATYQSKKIFSTYRLGQIIFWGQKQRQIIFSKTLPAPPQIMKWSLPKGKHCTYVNFEAAKASCLQTTAN